MFLEQVVHLYDLTMGIILGCEFWLAKSTLLQIILDLSLMTERGQSNIKVKLVAALLWEYRWLTIRLWLYTAIGQ